VHFLVKKNFDFIEMHSTTMKIVNWPTARNMDNVKLGRNWSCL